MTTQESLLILDNVAAAFVGNRADHVKIQEALATIRQELQKSEPVKEGTVIEGETVPQKK